MKCLTYDPTPIIKVFRNREFTYGDVATMCKLPEDTAKHAVQDLVSRGHVVEAGLSGTIKIWVFA